LNKTHGGNIHEIAQELGQRPEKIIDFSASINPLGISKRAERKLRESFAAIHHYPDSRCEALRETLAQFHGLEKDQILPGAGSTEFIYAIPRVLQITRVLIVRPAFSEYENALENYPMLNCTIHYFETQEEDGFEINVESLLFTLTQGYDALYLANPGNPTGILADREGLLKILAQTEKEKTWFILDEAFIDFWEEGSLKREVGRSSGLVILRSLTKFFSLPGLRVGYMLSNPEVIQEFSRHQEPWTVNALAQIAGVESLKDRGYITRTKKNTEVERHHLTQGLRSLPGLIPYPTKANYLLVQIHPSLDLTAAELRARLIPRGILIRDCSSFQPMGPYFLRIAVRSRKENNYLLEALAEAVISPRGGGSRKNENSGDPSSVS
jgi:threonine-phosphate decarboxylase